MNISENWHGRDRGVSPVIAVILMVAITVILSAVIGTFVLDMSDKLNESPPNTQFDFEQNEISVNMRTRYPTYLVVNITHIGGEQVEKSNLRVTVGGMQSYAVFDVWNGGEVAASMPFEAFGNPNKPVTSGDQTTLLARVDEDAHADWNAEDLVEPTESHHSHYYASNGGDKLHMGNSDGNNPGGVQLQPSETVQVIWSSGDGPGTVLAEYQIKDNS